MTPYSKIYKKFLNKISDVKLLELTDEDIQDMLHEWFTSAVAKFRKCKNNLSDRDEILERFNVDLLDIEIEILAILMVREWLEPQLNSTLLTAQFFGSKEEKLGVCAPTVRCIWKHCSVFLRICWKTLRAIIPKQKDEICLNGMV